MSEDVYAQGGEMSIGDDIRLLCRELRRYRETEGTNPTVQVLAARAKLTADAFQRALQRGVDEGWLAMEDGDRTVSEGIRFPPTPTPPDLQVKNVAAFSFSPGQQPLWERIFLSVLAIFFITVLSILIFQGNPFHEQVWKIVKVFLALCAAAIGAFLPGMFLLQGERPGMAARATGAFACFLAVLWTL
jgi:hypothetical protein